MKKEVKKVGSDYGTGGYDYIGAGYGAGYGYYGYTDGYGDGYVYKDELEYKVLLQCKRCGRCCKTITLLQDSSWSIKLARFLILLFKAPKLIFKKPSCPYLTFENGLAKCLNYENRPQFCRDYYCDKCLIR